MKSPAKSAKNWACKPATHLRWRETVSVKRDGDEDKILGHQPLPVLETVDQTNQNLENFIRGKGRTRSIIRENNISAPLATSTADQRR